jgi:hypothetical protein
MRDHGVTNFPDPHVSESSGQTNITLQVPGGFKSSPAAQAARRACRGILPTPKDGAGQESNGPSRQALLAFARCIRSRGYPRFPDPSGQGELTAETVSAAGIDLQAPGFLAVADGCTSVTNGQITTAMVARAVNGGGQ